MKKKNNESVKTGNPKAEDKNTNTVNCNVPVEAATEESGMPFKKALYGYNPEEVNAFIAELRRAHETTLKLHEEKLASLKDDLALAMRERDYYIEKCKNQPQPPAKDVQPADGKIAEYELTVAKLNKKLKEAEEENAFLKSRPQNDDSEITEAYIKKIAELESRNNELKEKLESVSKENSHLSEQLKKTEALYNKQKASVLQLEETKARLASLENELNTKQEALKEQEEKTIAVSAEKEDLKSSLSELEIQNNIINRQLSEAQAETAALKQANKNLIFESAEKHSALENEFAGYKLAVHKELKLYGYYADRAEQTVAELTEQLARLRQSVGQTEL